MFEALHRLIGTKGKNPENSLPDTHQGEVVEVIHDSQDGPTISTLVVTKQHDPTDGSINSFDLGQSHQAGQAPDNPEVETNALLTEMSNNSNPVATRSGIPLSPEEVQRAMMLERMASGHFDDPEATLRRRERILRASSINTNEALPSQKANPEVEDDYYNLAEDTLDPLIKLNPNGEAEVILSSRKPDFRITIKGMRVALEKAVNIDELWRLSFNGEGEPIHLLVTNDQYEQIKQAIEEFARPDSQSETPEFKTFEIADSSGLSAWTSEIPVSSPVRARKPDVINKPQPPTTVGQDEPSPTDDYSLIASKTPKHFDLSGSGTPPDYELQESVEQAIERSELTDSQKKWLKRLTLGATATLLALLLRTTIADRETSSSVHPNESGYSLLERHRQGWFSTPLIDQTQHSVSIEYPLTLPKPVPDGTQALTSPVASQLTEGHSPNPQPPEGKSGKDTAQTVTFENSHPWNEFIKTVESLGFSDKKVKIADGIKNALNALNTVINGDFKPDSIHQGVVTAVLSDSVASLVELHKLAETFSGKPLMFRVEQQKQLAEFIAAALSDTSNVAQEMESFIQTLITSAADEQSNVEIAKSIVENYPSKLEELLPVLTAHGSTESTEQPTAVRGSMTFEQ